MIFNITGGGKFAKITAYVPTNTAVTCSKSPFSFSKNSGSAKSVTFEVPVSGSWTVSMTWGGQTYTTTASVSTQGSTVSVRFRYYYFKAGEGAKNGLAYLGSQSYERAVWTTDNFVIVYDGHGVWQGQTAMVFPTSKVDLSNFSTFAVEAYTYNDTNEIWMLAGDSRSTGSQLSNKINEFVCPTRSTATYNISSLTGEKYVGLYHGSSMEVYVYNWYLES